MRAFIFNITQLIHIYDNVIIVSYHPTKQPINKRTYVVRTLIISLIMFKLISPYICTAAMPIHLGTDPRNHVKNNNAWGIRIHKFRDCCEEVPRYERRYQIRHLYLQRRFRHSTHLKCARRQADLSKGSYCKCIDSRTVSYTTHSSPF